MDLDQSKNETFVDFVGGVQLLQGDGTRTAVPVLLIGLCVSGAAGNLLVMLTFYRDFRHARGSEVKALLAAVAAADLAILLLCAPVRVVTYYRRSWTLGGFACSTADWFQHACVVAKTLTLATTSRAQHHAAAAAPGGGGPTWIHGALAFIWGVSATLPIPQFLFASLRPLGADTFVCVSETPVCAAEAMGLFYKVYPALTFALPAAFTLAYHVKALHAAVNRGGPARAGTRRQSKVTLVLLCVSGANALLLLPEWSAFTWTRLGHSKPPAGLAVFAQVLVYAGSCAPPAILMTMYDDVRRGVAALWFAATCRGAGRAAVRGCPKSGENGAEAGAHVGAAAAGEASSQGEPQDKTFPDVEHFWTGRRNTHVEDDQDPVPWEREEKML
ncbi:putative G-protein coupled receptor 151 [Merluccius polli]|uniref:G-protein coupled receptor 151 n=1 Tax=Merluccius polli TaxID=89951 RepID=A0AA47NYS8_MERPO|nr:putative G-protein coupled receptor 151 [Merluccius polli]